VPSVEASYKGIVNLSVQDGLTVSAIDRGGFRAGPLVRYGFGRSRSDNKRVLKGLANVGDAVEVGGFASYTLGEWELGLDVAYDVAGGHGGVVGEAGLTWSSSFGPLIVAAGPSLTLADQRYQSSFFGVSELESRRSGLSRHDADGGLQNVGLNAILIYPLTDRLSMVGLAGYARLLGDAADSPVVDEEGSPNQGFAGLFLTLRVF